MRGILRCRQTARANTVRPYVNLKGPLYTREALRWAVGGGVLDAPCNLALP